MFSELANKVFQESIVEYHKLDDVHQSFINPYLDNVIKNLLYKKSWVDTVQWHYEDIIRDPNIEPVAALKLKRMIDDSNQHRTNLVEDIDDYFLVKYKSVTPKKEATINSESPAWAIDRLSILALKIYHMKEETERKDASSEHRDKCQKKLFILLEQRKDLSSSIDQLLKDIEGGNKYMKVYRQMKMYNDEETNPILYQNK